MLNGTEMLLRYVHIAPGTNRFKNPSIFAEKDIYALLGLYANSSVERGAAGNCSSRVCL